MSRGEKLGWWAIGIALFLSLFYVIYDSYSNPTGPFETPAAFENVFPPTDLGVMPGTIEQTGEEAAKP